MTQHQNKTNNSEFTEQAALVAPLLKILSGPVIRLIQRQIEKQWLKKHGKKIEESWQYFSDSWKRITIKFQGKPHSFFIRIRHDSPHDWMEITTSLDDFAVYRNKYDIPNLKKFSDADIFYSFLRDNLNEFRRGLAQALKNGVTRKYRKLRRDKLKDQNRQPKGTKTFAAVAERFAAIALHFDPEQLKWACADFGRVSVDDYGSDEQTIIIARSKNPAHPPGFIYVTMDGKRSVTFKAMNALFSMECNGIIINTIGDVEEKLRAFENTIMTLGRHLTEYANGMPYSPRSGEMREYVQANKRKMPEVDRIRIHRPGMYLDVTSPFLPNMTVQIFKAKGPKSLEYAAQSIANF